MFTTLIILLFFISCFSTSFADSSSSNDFITPVSINEYDVIFSDGFTGFALDSDKNISLNDTFSEVESVDGEVENHVKLAIIECYKQEKINIAEIISKIINHKDDAFSDLNTSKQVRNHEVVNISNETEATFDFKVLEASSNESSDYITYKVSFKSIENNSVKTASNNSSKNKTVKTSSVKDNNTNTTPKSNLTKAIPDNIQLSPLVPSQLVADTSMEVKKIILSSVI